MDRAGGVSFSEKSARCREMADHAKGV